MKSMIVFALFVAVAMAGVPARRGTIDPAQQSTILRYDSDNIGLDGYKFNVETSDGKSVSEEGVLKNIGSENPALEVRGQFSYVAPDGITYTVTYIANENGFQPQGAHIPQA